MESSAPSTPRSSRTDTVAMDGELTPRSKVKAMLAALDADSESDEEEVATTTTRVKEIAPSEESEGSDEEVVPRGRLAQRLHKARTEDQNEESAYERVRKFLEKKPVEEDNVDQTMEDAEDDEEEVAPVSRKLVSRRGKKVMSDEESPANDSPQSAAQTPKPTSPARSFAKDDSDSDSDLPANPETSTRFLALVAKKRAERLAKEAKEQEKRAEREKALSQKRDRILSDEIQDWMSDEGEDDAASGRKLTQQSRPARKAGKKALEEMSRETQRISRNMQLAHEARTRKKITKDSFLARFKTKSALPMAAQISSSTTASSAPASDAEGKKEHQTPPTSPEKPQDVDNKTSEVVPSTEGVGGFLTDDESDFELPDLQGAISQGLEQAKQKLAEETIQVVNCSVEDDGVTYPDIDTTASKGKGPAKKIPEPINEAPKDPAPNALAPPKKHLFKQASIKVKPPKRPIRPATYATDSESDLEIIPTRKSKSHALDVLNRVPQQKKTQEAQSLLKLRALAHLTSPGKLKGSKKSSITATELQMNLRRQARLQAVKEKEERIQSLKDRGIIIQTAEEKAKDQADIDDMFERARREAQDLAKKEKEEIKKERLENGEDADVLDSSDDESYRGEDEPDVELSGSDVADEENEGDEDADGEVDSDTAGANLIDNEASDTEDDSGEDAADDEMADESEEDLPAVPAARARRGKITRILDEDEEDVVQEEPKKRESTSQPPSTMPLTNPPAVTNPFGNANPETIEAPMGLTQAFAASMADELESEEEQDSLAILNEIPEPDFPMLGRMDSIVMDSQNRETQPLDIDLHITQPQIGGDTQVVDSFALATQEQDIPDASQDMGFGLTSPIAARFAPVPPSTVDTVIIPPQVIPESPVVQRKGRLMRRAEMVAAFSDDEETVPQVEDAEFEISENAFDSMKKAAKKMKRKEEREAFDKKKSNAKEMIEEQAEESEDEYAGLGGADGENSDSEEDEEVKKMIDESEVVVDERKLAAFYADKDRAADEKAVEKLFKDINNGMLRRKRGAELDLSDSEDDAEDRRRRKRQEFERMRKRLLENENLGKIAEDPKKLAFLRAVEDREDYEDLGFLDGPDAIDENTEEIPDSQADAATTTTAPTPISNALKRKRPLQESNPPPNPNTKRRTIAPSKKPASLAEIRASVSFLIEEPHGESAPTEVSSDIEEPSHPRRTQKPIIDRLSLKRHSSSSLSTEGRLAFHNSSSTDSFKVPSLLRKMTSSFSSRTDENGISTHVQKGYVETERAAGGGEKGEFVSKAKGGKKSSINFVAREEERSKVLREVEGRKVEGRKKVAGKRRGFLGGLFGAGGFE